MTIASVPLPAATRRSPSIDVSGTGKLRASWFDDSSASTAISADHGATWGTPTRLDPAVGAGAGAAAWTDRGDSAPLLAWIEDLGSSRRPNVGRALVAFPNAKTLPLIGPERWIEGARKDCDIGIASTEKWTYVTYRQPGQDRTAAVRVNKQDVAIDVRPDADMSNVTVIWVAPDGKQKIVMTDTDTWRIPEGTRGIGPVIAASGRSAVMAYYSEGRTKRGEASITVFLIQEATSGLIAPTGALSLPSFGQGRDLHVHLNASGLPILSLIEREVLSVRRVDGRGVVTQVATPGASAVKLLWAGSLGDRDFVAYQSIYRRVTFAHVPSKPAATP